MQVIDAEQNVLIYLANSFDFIHATQCIYLGNNVIRTRQTQCIYFWATLQISHMQLNTCI